MGNKLGKVSSPAFREEAAGFESDSAVGDRLKNVPLLSKYTPEELGILGKLLKEQAFSDGEVILRQGDPGEGFFIIQDGSVLVTRKNDDGDVIKLGELSAGDYFGEFALINNKARGATVTAKGPTVTFFLLRNDFTRLFNPSQLNVHFAKRVAVSSETTQEQGASTYNLPAGVSTKKTAAEALLIYEAVKHNILFKGLDKPLAEKAIAEMYCETIKTGESPIKQGDKGELFYCVESGQFDIFVGGNKVADRGPSTTFGELALMYNAPRAATVTAMEDCRVWVIHRQAFRKVVKDTSSATLNEYASFLKSVDLLAPLANYERAQIAQLLEVKVFPAGEVIFEQGVPGNAMYIVESGEVVIHKDNVEIMNSKRGDFFGERALLKDEPRAAKVTAVKECKLLMLDKMAFDILLGPLENILQQQVQSYDTSPHAQGGGHLSVAARMKEQAAIEEHIPFEKLVVLGTLGKGSFGHVQLVQHKDDKSKTFALKAVSKTMIVETGQQGHIMSEKNVMMQLKHPFLIRLHQTYRDRDRLYFLLEPALGGELFTVLRAQTLFDEKTSRFYASCVLLAFEHMHSFDIVYRDLKPENLLIDQMGYIKITDFGFAKEISTGRTWTLCGTPDYLAPEIVAGKGHGKGVDWWTLGILIYEMLASYPPFYDDNPMLTYHKIMNGDIAFPEQFSRSAISLIKKLLYRKATRRLGVVKGGASLIKKHLWFDGFNEESGGTNGWDKLYRKEIKAPMIPNIASLTDLSNFEDVEDEDPVMPYQDDGSNWEALF